MPVAKIKDLYEDPRAYEGLDLTVRGWVRTIRDMKSIGFVELNDGSCFKGAQIIIEEGRLANYRDIARQNAGAALIVRGAFKLTENAKQPFEIQAEDVFVEGCSAPDYPLQKKRHSLERLRAVAHLRPRTSLFSAVFRIRSVAAHAIHCFFQERGFVYVHTPIITCGDAEGAGEMFAVTTIDIASPPTSNDGMVDYSRDFFGKKAGLTVSGQLNAEAYAMAFGSVYAFGPTFRAENSNTTRHAAEFWMIEPEVAFADLNDNMRLAEDMLKSVIEDVLGKCPFELEFLDSYVDKGLIERLRAVAKAEFASVTYTQAIEMLAGCGEDFVYPVSWGCNLQTEHERYLTEKRFGKPVFVTDYPKDIKAFYMRLNDDGKTVAAMDLLVPGIGELIGGSQREERLDVLEPRLGELGADSGTYGWYLDLRRYGSVRHAGFGLGFERLVMYLTGVSNIRDAIPYPRTPGSAEF